MYIHVSTPCMYPGVSLSNSTALVTASYLSLHACISHTNSHTYSDVLSPNWSNQFVVNDREHGHLEEGGKEHPTVVEPLRHLQGLLLRGRLILILIIIGLEHIVHDVVLWGGQRGGDVERERDHSY